MSSTNAFDPALAAIPIVDIRNGGPVQHVKERSLEARRVRDYCLASLPRSMGLLVPLFDATARRWLARSASPYVKEIGQIAATIALPGVWLLNGSYQWGCTTLAREENGMPWLVRTLDWPFAGLGRCAEVAHLRGESGDFFNVTWPGYVGVLTAMAPHRFAACINQAPMWRRTLHPWLRLCDHAVNVVQTYAGIRHMPPDHLLRRTFELCDSYGAARRMLETTPVARPAIYTLVGCERGERCVIERSEDGFLTRSDETSTANDWVPPRPRWEARMGAKDLFTKSYADAAGQSRARREALVGWNGVVSGGGFDWVTPPVLNPYTRLAVAMSPREAVLQVVGYERTNSELPQAVTATCCMASAAAGVH